MAIAASFSAALVRIMVLKGLVSFDIKRYLQGIVPCLFITVIYSLLLFQGIKFFFDKYWFWQVVLYLGIAFPASVYVEMSKGERNLLLSKIKRQFNAKI